MHSLIAEPASQSGPEQLSEKAFLVNLEALKEQLLEDSRSNMRSLTGCNRNFNEAFAQLKGVIRRLTIANRNLKHRVSQLEQAIAVIQPHHSLLSIHQTQSINQFTPVSHPHKANLQNLAKSDFELRVEKPRQPEIAVEMEAQGRQIKEFVWEYLGENMQFDPLGGEVPKEMVVALYLRWKRLSGEEYCGGLPLLESRLAAELTRLLPRAALTPTAFTHVRWKHSLLQAVLASPPTPGAQGEEECGSSLEIELE